MSGGHPDRRWIWKSPFPVWLALCVLLGATGTIAWLPLGIGNMLVSTAIGMIKAILIALFFMHLVRAKGTLWLAGLAGLLFLFTMFLLTFGDYTTRPNWWHPAPVPPGQSNLEFPEHALHP
ncbi:MAG TPA: hypothetical protein VGL35_04335 [Rhizomicrobium sp.]|jgi:cytochrome c oxidase subunit 4